MTRCRIATSVLARILLAVVLASPLLSVSGATPTRAADAERVRIPANGVTLPALLYKPAGAGPFPAVVALHGCGGLFGRDGQVSRREAAWADALVADGFAVVLPDSFGPRGLGPQCRTRERKVRASVERRDDAHAARLWLQQRPDVKPTAVSLMGWSNGGTGVLHAVRSERLTRPGRSFRVVGTDFAVAVAFYPGCRIISERPYRPRVPLTILIGDADDWTPAKTCESLAAKAKGATPPLTLVVYPGAHHDFDWPDRPVGVVPGVVTAGRGATDVHAGTNPAARADALRRVPTILAR